MSNVVLKNILNNMVTTGINVLVPIVTIPLLVTGLGIDSYGYYVTVLAKVSLVYVLADFGLGMLLGKELSIYRDNPIKISYYFWSYFFIKLTFIILFLTVYIFLSDCITHLDFIFFGIILFQVIDVSPLLTGLEKYKFQAKIQFLSKLFLLITLVSVNFDNYGIEKALVVTFISSLIVSLGTMIYFFNITRFIKPNLNYTDYFKTLKKSLPFYGAKALVNAYQQSSTYFVSLVLSIDLVAIYSISLQLYKLGQVVIGSISRVLYTSTVKTNDYTLLKKVTLTCIGIHILFMPIVLLFGESILSVIFDENADSITKISTIFYCSMLFSIVSSFWGYPALTPINKEYFAHVGIFVSSVSYYICFSLVYYSGSIGLLELVLCVVTADFMAMLFRIFFAYKFDLFKRSKKSY